MLAAAIQSPEPTAPARPEPPIAAGRRRLPLSRSEEASLAIRTRRGDQEARRTLIETNRPMVVAVALRYRGCGLELDDLIQEGMIGLMHGIDRFDHHRGCRLPTYASWWVRQAIQQAVANDGHAIRLPASAIAKLHRIERSRERIAAELGREPSARELAAATGIPGESIAELLAVAGRPLSLDQPAPGADRPLGDLLADRAGKAGDGCRDELAAQSVVSDVLSALPDPRQRRVLELHYGLGARKPSSVRSVGVALGVSGARVCQLKAAALQNLRGLPAAARWRDVLAA